MTDTTTADKLAAWQLIEEHGLCVCPMSGADGFNAFQLHVGADAGIGTTPAAAVKAWAEAAGVPWPSVKVVPMLAVMDGRGGVQMVAQPCDEGMARRLYGDRQPMKSACVH